MSSEASNGAASSKWSLEDLIIRGHKFGQPRYRISEDEAAQHGQKSGLPVWQPTLAQQYRGYKDLWSFSGRDNLDATPAPMTFLRLPVQPNWAGYMAYRKPEEGDAADRGELVIVFRGTQLKSEWLNDAVAGITGIWEPEFYDSKRPEMGKVHNGFYHIYAAGTSEAGSNDQIPKQVVEQALQAAKDRQGPFKDHPFPRVTTVGHSLGGALAALCALHVADWLERNNVPVSNEDVTAYTYDAPRTGDETLAKQINNRVTMWRMVNKRDIVPRVPPAGLGDFLSLGLLRALWELVPRPHKRWGLNWDWHHGGVLLEYDPIELGKQLGQKSPYDPNRRWGGGDHHNLQLLLYAIAQAANLSRAPTSINKGANILKRELNIPPSFFDPEGAPPNKGVQGFPRFDPPGY